METPEPPSIPSARRRPPRERTPVGLANKIEEPGARTSIPSAAVGGATLSVERDGNWAILLVTGQVDSDAAIEVTETIRGLLALGVVELVVDLTNARGGPELLGLLSRARIGLIARGGSLRLAGLVLPEFLPALDAAPLEQVFLVYDAIRRDIVSGRRATGGR